MPRHASGGGFMPGCPQVPLSIEQASPATQMTAPQIGWQSTVLSDGRQLLFAAQSSQGSTGVRGSSAKSQRR